jgi:hypothetical protein
MGSSMRVPGGSDTKATKTETEAKKAQAEASQTEEMKSFVTYLLAHSKKLPPSKKPVEQFGYLERDPADPGTGLLLREDVIKAQQELKDFPGDDKGLNDLYRDLHEIQGEYVDAVLRGESPDLKAFKDKQEAKITQCNEILEELLKKDAKGEPKADPAIIPRITKQKELLAKLPSQIEPTRSHLIDQLKREKQRYLGERSDKEINAKENMEDYMFSVYMKGKGKHASDRDKAIKDDLRKYGDVGDDALAGGKTVLTDDKGNKTFANKISLGYTEAKKIITEEMERAEREPPHESFFIPFGKESDDVNYLIRRYKEKGQWYLEAHMLDENRITEPKEFKDMVEELFRFQKFAGCETDVVKLSFGAAVYSKKYVNERADYILEMIALLKEKGSQNPPTKKLELDDHAKNALFKCGKEKRKKVEDALRELEKQSKQDYETLQKEAKPEVVDIRKLNDDMAASVNKSVTVISDASKPELLYLKCLSADDYSARHLKGILDDKKSTREEIIQGEKKAIEALSGALADVQSTLGTAIQEINKVFNNNKNDPALDTLLRNLNELMFTEQRISSQLERRSKSLTLLSANVDKAEDALKTIEDKESRLEKMKADSKVTDSDRRAQEVLIMHEKEKLKDEIGGLDRADIDAFKDNLAGPVKKISDEVASKKQKGINLAAGFKEIGDKIAHAKGEKESALSRYGKR